MNEWDIIISEINELGRSGSVVETGSEDRHNTRSLLEHIKSLKRALDNEKEVLKKKLAEAENNHQRLWELLDNKNAETEILDQINKKAKQENEMLLIQLHQVQEELEVDFLRQQQQPANENVNAYNLLKSKQQLIKEIEALRQTLSWRITTPCRRFRAVVLGRKHKSQYVFVEKSKQQLINNLESLQKSWSWRVTAPLRWLMWNLYKKKE